MHAAKTHLSRLVDQVAGGAEVVIAKAGKPVARLVPYRPAPRPKQFGVLKNRIRIPAGFNESLHSTSPIRRGGPT
ncbi:MAG: type II toxin-antitoxin system prevent-host-death family antitoxin [Acidobacteriota bacterium]